jgi:hypothetical protein
MSGKRCYLEESIIVLQFSSKRLVIVLWRYEPQARSYFTRDAVLFGL